MFPKNYIKIICIISFCYVFILLLMNAHNGWSLLCECKAFLVLKTYTFLPLQLIIFHTVKTAKEGELEKPYLTASQELDIY